MSSVKSDEVAAGASHDRRGHPRPFSRLVVTGLGAALAAVVATTLAAALARAGGIDFQVQGGERIPLGGFAVITLLSSVTGVAISLALLRWSARPADRFLWTAAILTAVSMVPPLLYGDSAATTAALGGLHLVAAAVMVPALTHSLRAGAVSAR